MGHIRLGRLPKTLRWRQVLDLLGEASLDTPAIARATTFAAERRLQDLARDPTLTYAFWLLTRLTTAARHFFGDFFARTLRSFVERELPNQTGPGQRPRSVEDNQTFAESLDRYTRESALIMESFAVGWYGKHNWESRGRISRQEAQGF